MIVLFIDNIIIGRLHPLLVHLPIGFYILYIFIYFYRGHLILFKLGNIILGLAAIVCTFTAITGYLLAPYKGYDTNILQYHQWLGIGLAIVGWILWWINRTSENKLLKNTFLVLLSILIIITGHLGGSLTHGKNYLISSNDKIPTVSVPNSIDSINYYTHVIKPILYTYCLSCHQPSKKSGDWDISTDSSLLKGGKYGHTIIAGDVEHSELIKRLESSISSKKHMPPITMPQPKAIELFLLKEWIKNGAKTEKAEIDENVQTVIKAYLGITLQDNKEQTLPIIHPMDTSIYNSIKKKIGIIHPITEGSNLLDISLIHFRKKSKTEILTACNLLKSIAEHIYWLDLAGLALSSSELDFLSDMKNLNKLNLSHNKVDDDALKYISKLPNLNFLNLFGTHLTENGKTELLKQPKLKIVGIE